ncbi:MAG: hypothetical protein M3Q30_27700 [Actinomycetota bacterium]|nr:hypothetical protein [Actinomycetota bacterium]
MADDESEATAVALDVVAAIVQAVPVVGGPIGGLAQARTNHQQRRWNQFVVALGESWDAEMSALAERCSDERILELVLHGIRDAEAAFRDTQVRVAAAIVVGGSRPGGGADAESRRIDTAHLLLDVAANLTLGEVEMLAWIVPGRSAASGEEIFEADGRHTVHMIEQTNERFVGVAEPLLERLRARGLAERIDVEESPRVTTFPSAGEGPKIVSMRSAPVWRATGFGRDMLRYLRDVGEEAAG